MYLIQGRLAVALGFSTAAHVGLAWMVAVQTPSSAAPARRALSVAMTPAAPRAVLNSIAPAASAALAPAVVQPLSPPVVKAIEAVDGQAVTHSVRVVETLQPPLVDTQPARQRLQARDSKSAVIPVAVATAQMSVARAHQRDKLEKPLPRPLRAAPSAAREPPAAQASAASAVSPPGERGSGSQAVASQAVAGQPGDDRDALPAAGNEPPQYPWTSRAQGHQGRVMLQVWVSADGAADRLAILKSSGYAVLDRAALEAVQRWRFQPARRGGLETESLLHVPVVFRLDEGG